MGSIKEKIVVIEKILKEKGFKSHLIEINLYPYLIFEKEEVKVTFLISELPHVSSDYVVRKVEYEFAKLTKKCICELKEGEQKELTKGDWVDLYITLERGEYRIEAISDGRASMKINFCPECGRSLEESRE